MSFRYLLDTNIVSQIVRRPYGDVAQRIASVGQNLVATSIIVAAELRFGARKKGSAALARQLDAVLGVLQILPLEIPVDEAYAGLRATLEAAGTMIDANDTLIGAHALSLDMILVTDNVREFERIPGLVVENWLR